MIENSSHLAELSFWAVCQFKNILLPQLTYGSSWYSFLCNHESQTHHYMKMKTNGWVLSSTALAPLVQARVQSHLLFPFRDSAAWESSHAMVSRGTQLPCHRAMAHSLRGTLAMLKSWIPTSCCILTVSYCKLMLANWKIKVKVSKEALSLVVPWGSFC